MNLKTLLEKRSKGQGEALLHGSDVPVGKKWIIITVGAIREAPDGFTAVAIIDFPEPIYGNLAWAVNKTNMKKIITLFGDDEKSLVGRKIRLDVVSVRNPKTGEMVRSLVVSDKQ